MDIVEWPEGVSRIVTSESQLTIGENSLITDKSENGAEMSRLAASDSPDRWTVVIWFSNSTQDSFYRNHTDEYGNHVTEWQRFILWFKHIAMMGTRPFYFASLSDPDGKRKALYKILSSGLPKGTAQGDKIKCTMTWVEVFTGAITIQEPVMSADSLSASNGELDFRFLEPPETEEDGDVRLENFSASYQYGKTYEELADKGSLTLYGYDYDGYRSVILYFDEFRTDGVYRIAVTYSHTGTEAESTVSSLLYVQEEP